MTASSPTPPPSAAPGRAWLDVPFSEKDQAKAHGARWDPAAKRWYDPQPHTAGLAPWAPLPDVPNLLPGEDREFGSGLFVDLVPRSCWFTNVRTCVTERDWERLRRMTRRRAEHRCEICGAAQDRSRQLFLEAHERWSYNDVTGVQTLRRLVCLCSACHLSTHFGHANVTGRTGEALAHLRAVTGMTAAQADQHIAAAERLWIERSAGTWRLDLSILTDAGVTLAPPPGAAERARAADDQRSTADNQAATPPAPPTAPVGRRRSPAPTRQPPPTTATPTDLADAIPGQAVTREATRRRAYAPGADRSWRVGADGEVAVAAQLRELTEPSWWDRLRGRQPVWRVLHSVPIGDGHGNERGDIDHVLIGPPGVITINTKHHRTGRLDLHGDQLVLNGRLTDYVPSARREADRASALLSSAVATEAPALLRQLQVRPVIVIVGGRLIVRDWAPGVTVIMAERLLHSIRAFRPTLRPDDVAMFYAIARRSSTWNPPSHG